MTAFAWVRPSSLREATDLLASRPGARPLSGGTDLLPSLRDGCREADLLVSLGACPELAGTSTTKDGSLSLGALTPVGRLAADPDLHARYTALAQAAAAVASPQIRNQGTLGGNLCQDMRCPYYRGGHACTRRGEGSCSALGGIARGHAILGGGACVAVHPSDLAPALVALDATALLWARRSRRLPVQSLFVRPQEDPTLTTRVGAGEVLAEVLLPPPPPGLRSSYRKVRGRQAWDFALAGCALALVVADGVVTHVRVVLSGVAPVPWRSTAAEETLLGQAITPSLCATAAEAAVAGARPLAGNDYKIDMARALVCDGLLELAT